MNVRCKFRLTKVSSEHYETSKQKPDGTWGPDIELQHVLEFTAVTGHQKHSSEENKTFWKYTPAGELKVHCASGEIADDMAKRIGQEFYIDIQPATAEAS